MADVNTSTWEYRVEKVGSALRAPKPELLTELLNQSAAEGWEPMHLTPVSSTYQVLLVLRRPVSRQTRRRASWPDSDA
jgi:hypothetical protein